MAVVLLTMVVCSRNLGFGFRKLVRSGGKSVSVFGVTGFICVPEMGEYCLHKYGDIL